MKKKINDYVRTNFPHSFTAYSGHTKTMFIYSKDKSAIMKAIFETFGLNLPFKLS